MRSTVAALCLAAATLSAAAPETFGTGVTLEQPTPIVNLIERPADFEGRTVRVEGVVTAVCEHKGCWMAFAPETAPGGATLHVKVDDGVIVFPMTAKGKRASAQGVIERVGGSAESREAALEHARHTGTPAAPAAPAMWQLKATGAVVY